MTYLWWIILFAGGYAASIYTWPTVRYLANGAEAEMDRLRKALDVLKGR